MQLDNGDVVLSVLSSGETEFYYLDADAQEVTSVGTIAAEVGALLQSSAPVVTHFTLARPFRMGAQDLMTRPGFNRLMFLAQADDELFIVDTRHSNSARTLAVQQDSSPSFRLFGGF